MSSAKRALLTDYPICIELDTRWMDNDIYGHVNNVVYYSYFDTIVNRYLIEKAELDIHAGDIIGLIVNSHCNYHTSISFPDKLMGGLKVTRIGSSSVDYSLGIFKHGQELACAEGQMTHVFVNRADRRPRPISGTLLTALSKALK
ncbi:acyl-CoA thioesterase [Glaciecola petra]|uniref:Thioesterase family protein n=1 Tax=Glaciecola petra TaxID=3075602 RepID=A0ABU2ZUA4_9ALTE|nr:thioesterase family protein [Aestuariibacter sp. P117]MDT0596223.1 thioesterase family protein [Aestuariibacter sp. P117]